MRNFTVVDAEQRSEAWRKARLGRLTGSRAKDVLATIKTGEAAARRDYRLELICERLTGLAQEDGFVSDAMTRGVELEPVARAAYECATGEMVRSSGFLSHTAVMAGASLDGHIGDFDGILELKAPKTSTHLKWLRAGVVPPDHLPQVLNNLWVSGAAWCDFASFDDRLPGSLQLFIVRYERNEQAIKDYEQKALAFLMEVETELAALQTMGNLSGQLAASL